MQRALGCVLGVVVYAAAADTMGACTISVGVTLPAANQLQPNSTFTFIELFELLCAHHGRSPLLTHRAFV